MLTEIFEIPHLARMCFERNKGLILPEKVPYIGMGSSYYAAISLRYQGIKIYPELASEYYNYLENTKQFERAVLISQSGLSSETLWCADRFEGIVPIVNDENSALAKHTNVDFAVNIHAGVENYSPTKTYINTLVVLFAGHGINPQPAFKSLNDRFPVIIQEGEELGQKLYRLTRRRRYKGFYVLGSGPNVGTAMQAALILTESTRIPFIGMSVSQYDHGIKEAAKGSVVVLINPEGKQTDRNKKVKQRIEQAGAICLELNENELPESLSPFTLSVKLFATTCWMSKKLKIDHPFIVGDKVTRVTS